MPLLSHASRVEGVGGREGGGGSSQSVLLKRTALVAGALTAIVLAAGLCPLVLNGRGAGAAAVACE